MFRQRILGLLLLALLPGCKPSVDMSKRDSLLREYLIGNWVCNVRPSDTTEQGPAKSGEMLAFVFRPDGTFTAKYKSPLGGAQGLAADVFMKNLAGFQFTGKWWIHWSELHLELESSSNPLITAMEAGGEWKQYSGQIPTVSNNRFMAGTCMYERDR